MYVAAPNGFLYAWNASNGHRVWRSVVAIPSRKQNDYFNWSSPTVANGKIYVGVSSNCDHPLVQGGEKVYDEASGQLLATFDTTPPNDVGGSIWSSALVASDGSVYVTTGNQDPQGGPPGYSQSIVRLDGNSFKSTTTGRSLRTSRPWTVISEVRRPSGPPPFRGAQPKWSAPATRTAPTTRWMLPT